MPKTRVLCFERVVPRGTQRVDWSVQVNDGWKRATDVGRRVEDAPERPTQCIWQSLIEVETEPGTLFERSVTQPRPLPRAQGGQAPSVVSFLESGKGRSLQTQRTRYRLSQNGVLERVTPQDGR